ncbi:hypothetical protein KP509_16G052100 [Ceratopteris richardii]|uniref:Pentatricopeptide repeat-containing protein n=1 Tax=Ceratopteris richardii TaxID=49495 RepID=A0A8T2T301_CERRI|nr:hypothetical protein KP509_16G052100 [Ceratopteris richardii]
MGLGGGCFGKKRDVVAWDALIKGYLNSGQLHYAIDMYKRCERGSKSGHFYLCPESLQQHGALDKDLDTHCEIERLRLLQKESSFGNILVDMYAQGARDIVTWNVLSARYAENGKGDDALKYYEELKHLEIVPEAVTVVSSLRFYGLIGALDKGREIHAEIERRGTFKYNQLVGNTLIDFHAKCDMLGVAPKVFEGLAFRDVISWNMLIAGYVEHGYYEEALKYLDDMQLQGVYPDSITFIYSLKACNSEATVDKTRYIHTDLERKNLLKTEPVGGTSLVDIDVVAWDALIKGYLNSGQLHYAIDMYKRCERGSKSGHFYLCPESLQQHGALDKDLDTHCEIERLRLLQKESSFGGWLSWAKEVFENLPARDIVTWNVLSARYAENGKGDDALKYYEEMKHLEIVPDAVTVVSSLRFCGLIGALDKGREIHAEIERRGTFKYNQLVGNTLIDFHAKCDMLGVAPKVFEGLDFRDVISWNMLIAGYVEHGYYEEALKYLDDMQFQGVYPDSITFIYSLKACNSEATVDKTRYIHTDLERKNLLETEPVVGTSLRAHEVFDVLPARDHFLWNTLSAEYVEQSMLYEELKHLEIVPEAVTVVSSLRFCGLIGALDKGREIHAEIERRGTFKYNQLVGNTLIDFHAKCDMLGVAPKVFEGLAFRDVISWNMLIAGYVEHGYYEEALKYLDDMRLQGVYPDSITFIYSLKACNSEATVDKTRYIHTDLERKNLLETEPVIGLLQRAHEVFDVLPARDHFSWNTLSAEYVEQSICGAI